MKEYFLSRRFRDFKNKFPKIKLANSAILFTKRFCVILYTFRAIRKISPKIGRFVDKIFK